MICSAIPVLKPVMTALETKFMIAPKRSSPKMSITTPTTTASAATLAGSVGSRPDSFSTLRDDSAIALVRVVTISTVRAKTEATMPGTTPEYRPTTGLNPPMLAYAIPSGMENRPVTRPASTSRGVGRPSRRTAEPTLDTCAGALLTA